MLLSICICKSLCNAHKILVLRTESSHGPSKLPRKKRGFSLFQGYHRLTNFHMFKHVFLTIAGILREEKWIKIIIDQTYVTITDEKISLLRGL